MHTCTSVPSTMHRVYTKKLMEKHFFPAFPLPAFSCLLKHVQSRQMLLQQDATFQHSAGLKCLTFPKPHKKIPQTSIQTDENSLYTTIPTVFSTFSLNSRLLLDGNTEDLRQDVLLGLMNAQHFVAYSHELINHRDKLPHLLLWLTTEWWDWWARDVKRFFIKTIWLFKIYGIYTLQKNTLWLPEGRDTHRYYTP